jgi:hypothetical protein
MIRIDAIPNTSKRKNNGLFTSTLSAAAMIGLYVGVASIIFQMH